MPNRRNFHPDRDDADYENQHIKFSVTVGADLHNVGSDFSLEDAQTWLDEALERGLHTADPNDKARVLTVSAKLIERPECKCYAEEQP